MLIKISLVFLLITIISCIQTDKTCAGEYATAEDVKKQKEAAVAAMISEAEALKIKDLEKSYIGVTYWIEPNPKSYYRLEFYSSITDSGGLNSPFYPMSTTSFIVKNIKLVPNILYKYDYKKNTFTYLEIEFPDGKKGYVFADAIKAHLYEVNRYKGMRFDSSEYVYDKSPQEIAVIEQEEAKVKEKKSKEAEEAEREKEAARVVKAVMPAEKAVKPNMKSKKVSSSSSYGCKQYKTATLRRMNAIQLQSIINDNQRVASRILRSLQGDENPDMDPVYACQAESYRVLEVLYSK